MYRTFLFLALTLTISEWGFSQTEAAQPNQKPVAKRLISAGWDMPTTEYLRANWREMDNWNLFDGCTFNLTALSGDKKKRLSSCGIWDAQVWEPAWFQTAREDLAACQFQNMTSNMVLIISHPGTVRWNDDPGWTILRDKLSLLSDVARAGKVIGFALDFEDYGGGLFSWNPDSDPAWKKTNQLARKRGAEFIHALTDKFPSAVLMAYNLNNMLYSEGEADNPDSALRGNAYALLPAFINGMLDALPPQAKLIDGCGYGYVMNSRTEFLERYRIMKQWNGPCARLTAPENQAKYRTQVQAGFGLYLDSYINEPGSSYYFGEKEGGTRLDHFIDNLKTALDCSDEFVWLYGEGGRWYGQKSLYEFVENPEVKSVGKFRGWEQLLPGISEQIRWTRDPSGWANRRLERLKEEGKLVNLVLNHDFTDGPQRKENEKADEPAPSGMPQNYAFWQSSWSKGTAVWDPNITYPGNPNGSCRFEKTNQGCVIQSIFVESGQRYLVRFAVKKQGAAEVDLLLQWQDSKGNWLHDIPNKTVWPLEPNENGWAIGEATFEVSPAVGKLVLTAEVKRQSDSGKVWFDALEAYRISD